MSGNLNRHLQMVNSEMNSLEGAVESLKTDVLSLHQQYDQLKHLLETNVLAEAKVNKPDQSSELKSIVTAVHSTRSQATILQKKMKRLSTNLTESIQNVSKSLDSLVTKQYLHKKLLDLKPQSLMSSLGIPISASSCSARLNHADTSAEDCWEVKHKMAVNESGVYQVRPRGSLAPFFVYCDMETDGGGWTVIQRRLDGSVDFLKEWIDYKHGLGNIAGEFWLGNEKIHHLTNQYVNELLIELTDFDQQSAKAWYSAFATGNEAEGFPLKLLGHYKGDAGDSLQYHVGQKWSTVDLDNDEYRDRSCARDHMGGWWYRACDTSNLNGRYLHGPVPADHEYSGTYWYDFRGPLYSLYKTSMKIRRGGYVSQPVGSLDKKGVKYAV